MAFLSRSAQQEEFGSGGKFLRGRLPRSSPYSRPSSSLALLGTEPEAGGSPSWFRGLISGAGKLISSVIGSEGSGSASECSSDYSSDEEYDPPPNEHGDLLLSDKLVGFNKRESVVDGNVETLTIVPKSETKLVIEQLLLQETFTRDEYKKLMEILRSRVLDVPSAQVGEIFEEEFPGRVSEKSPWQSLNQNGNTFGHSSISPSNQSSFSRRCYISEVFSPDLRRRAVMEAKKWFEEKKLSPRLACDPECGPCVLNTDMNQYCLNYDSSSPVEMAKSYMQSLPPWRSPSFNTSPPSTEKHTSSNIGLHLLQSSKVRKRNYSTIGSLQSARDSLKLIADERGCSKLKPTGSVTGPALFEVSTISSAITNFGNNIQGIISDVPLTLHDREDVEVGHPLDMHKKSSHGSIVEIQDAFKEAHETPKTASKNFIEQLHSNINDILPCDSDMSMSDKNQDMEMPSVIKAQIDSISAPCDSLLMFSVAEGNDGNTSLETETFQHEIVIPREESIQGSKEDFILVNLDSDSKHDSQPPDGNAGILKETAPATNANGHFDEVNNMDSGLGSMSKGGPTATNSSNGGDSSFSEGTHQLPIDVSGKIPSAEGISSSARKPLNGAKMESTERISTEPSRLGGGKRKGKKVVRQKRWND